MRQLTDEELQWNLRVAWHVAGHAVMAYLHSPRSIKFLALALAGGTFQGVWEVDRTLLREAGAHAEPLTSAAGVAAEMLVLGAEFQQKYGEQVFAEIYSGEGIHDDPSDWTEGRGERIKYGAWRDLVGSAHERLVANLDGVTSVAIQLLKRGFIDGSELPELMTGSRVTRDPK